MDSHIQGYYQEYLSNLCFRRQWPAPLFTLGATRGGYQCVVRVNNREYESDPGFDNKRLAVENAAMRAYAICQNFSKSDGMYPTEKKKRGAKVQGRPIAIGTERQSTYFTDDSRSSGSSSGGSSPTNYGGFASYSSGRASSGSMSSGSSNGGGSSSKHVMSRSSGGSSRHSGYRSSGRR